MPVATAQIADVVARYLAQHPEERPGLQPLLPELDGAADPTSRSAQPGHVTAGAAVIDDRGLVLLIKHRTLERWLLPGGHLEPGDESLPAAALRELVEETGIGRLDIDCADAAALAADALPVDVDLHAIPANPAKGEPAHWHADFRYAFLAARLQVTLQLEEVSDFAWLPPSRLDSPRLAAKLALLADGQRQLGGQRDLGLRSFGPCTLGPGRPGRLVSWGLTGEAASVLDDVCEFFLLDGAAAGIGAGQGLLRTM